MLENNRYGRLVTVLVSPTKTFRSIAERPTWLVAVLVLILCTQLATLATLPKLDWEETIHYRLEQKGRELPPEQEAAVVAIMEKHGTPWILVFLAVLPWIFYPLAAAIFLGMFRLLGSGIRFRTSLSVWAHSLIPAALSMLASVVALMGTDELTIERLDRGVPIPNLSILAGEDPGLPLFTLLASIDVFSLWMVVLLILGYSITTKLPWQRVAACVVGLWLVFLAGITGLAALDQMLESWR